MTHLETLIYDRGQSRSLPLWTVLVIPFALQILLVVSLVGYLSFRNGQNAVNEVGRQLHMEISNRIHQHIDGYLKLPDRINQINAAALTEGALDWRNAEALLRQFWHQMKTFEAANYISFASENREFVGIERRDTGDLTIWQATLSYDYALRGYAADNQGRRGRVMTSDQDYDPRKRPWYRAAVQASAPIWTEISQFYNTELRVLLGTTAVSPVYSQEGNLVGVLGVDVILNHLSDFLRQLNMGHSGLTFIMERNGLLVASSKLKSPALITNDRKANRIKAADASDPLTLAATNALIERFHSLDGISQRGQVTFILDGARHSMQVLPYTNGRGIEWLIVVVLPESEFMSHINANTRATILLCLATLLLALLVGSLTSRLVTRPLVRLNSAAKKIACGEWTWTVDSSRITELSELGLNFNIMGGEVHKRTADLSQANTQLRVMATRLVEVEERGRRKVARQLHDMVGQNLSVLNLNLDIVRAQVAGNRFDDIPHRLDSAIGLVENVIAHIREVIVDLRPNILDECGLMAALFWYGDHFFKRTAIEVEVHGRDLSYPLSREVQNTFFRIAQEAMTNAAKHANVQHIRLAVVEDDEIIRMTIHDNGRGFDPTAPLGLNCCGLLNMRERALAAGAELQINSQPGMGTTVEMKLPKDKLPPIPRN